MATTDSSTVNPSDLRDEYGPAPWWSREHLAALLVEHNLSTAEIADAWGAHPETVRQWVHRHGLQDETGGRHA